MKESSRDKSVRLRSGVELPAGVPVIRAQVALTGPELPPASKLVGIRIEKPQAKPTPDNVVLLNPRQSVSGR